MVSELIRKSRNLMQVTPMKRRIQINFSTFDFNTKKALWGRVGLRYKKNDLTIRIGGSFGYGGLRYLGYNITDAADDIYADLHAILFYFTLFI